MLLRTTLIPILILFLSSCKKEECPAPIPAPIITRTVVWCSNSIVNTKDIVVYINNSTQQWSGIVMERYATNPGCGASDCYTIELPAGSYYIGAATEDGATTWGPLPLTVSATNSCGSFELQ